MASASKSRRALLGQHNALIPDLRGKQRHVASKPRLKTSLINDSTRRVRAEVVTALLEVTVSDVVNRDHKTSDIDLCSGSKYNPAGVTQKDLAIGLNATENLRWAGIEDAVENDRVSPWLLKLNAGTFTNIERIPFNDGLGRALLDGHRTRLRLNLCLSAGHHTARRKSRGRHSLCPDARAGHGSQDPEDNRAPDGTGKRVKRRDWHLDELG